MNTLTNSTTHYFICLEPKGVNTAATVLNQTQFQLKRNQFDPFLLYNYCHAQCAVYIIEKKYNSDMYVYDQLLDFFLLLK